MTGPSRAQADVLLAPARAGRPLYDELRPAYVALDPLVALLRRRRFSGVILAAGGPGEGALWLEEGRVSSAWLFPPGAGDAAVPSDPLEVLRVLWGDVDARVTVHPASPPPRAEGAPPFTAPRQTRSMNPATGEAAAALQPAPAVEEPGRVVPPAAATGAPVMPTLRRLIAPLRAPRPLPPGPPAVAAPETAPRAEEPFDPALAVVATVVPWSRLLPETLDRVRRHRGMPLAQRLEGTVNERIGPSATVVGREVVGAIDPMRAAGALRAIAAGVGAVAGAAFAERLLWTVGRDFACEEAVKRLLPAPPESEPE